MDFSQVQQLFTHNIERNELKKGDHIYSWRNGYLYSHCHGIYVDDGKVIHFTGSRGIRSSSDPCPKCGDQTRESGVISSCLDCFLDGGQLYRFQYGVSKVDFFIKVRGKCTTAASEKDADIVVRRAELLLLNNGFGKHDVVSHYSKHFALYCHTEKVLPRLPSDGGLDWIIHSLKSFLPYVNISLAQSPKSAVSKLLNARYNNDIGVRTDVKKIAVEDLARHFATSDAQN